MVSGPSANGAVVTLPVRLLVGGKLTIEMSTVEASSLGTRAPSAPLTYMRYFFHLHNDALTYDEEGADLPDEAAARDRLKTKRG